ncbi:MAG TPA: hypothetical protein VGK30_04525 [Candidatus Binatia bacterium]
MSATHFFLPEVHEFGGEACWKSGSIPDTTSSTNASTFCSIAFVSSCVAQIAWELRSSPAPIISKQLGWSAVPLKRVITRPVHAGSTAVPSLSAVMWHCSRPCAFWLAQRVWPLRHLLGAAASAIVANVRNAVSAAAPTTARFELDAMTLPPVVDCGALILARGKGLTGALPFLCRASKSLRGSHAFRYGKR